MIGALRVNKNNMTLNLRKSNKLSSWIFSSSIYFCFFHWLDILLVPQYLIHFFLLSFCFILSFTAVRLILDVIFGGARFDSLSSLTLLNVYNIRLF